MRVVFTPLTPALIPACRDFNERLRRAGEPPFTLPEKASPDIPGSDGYSSRHYVAVDENGSVRGGVLLTELRGWFKQTVIRLINIQSPISESIVDRTYSGIGLQMLKFIAQRSPYSYAVGMGGEQNPLPRLLKAAGWSVRAAPFSFTVIRPARFLREIGFLSSGYKRLLGRIIAISGLGTLALGCWRVVHSEPTLEDYSLEIADAWPQDMDAVWEQCGTELSFSALRDTVGLAILYPDTQPRLKRFLLRYRGKIVGWSVGVVTKMRNNRRFGNLTVGTILDGLTPHQHVPALLTLTQHGLRDMGAELILTNQTNIQWHREIRRRGYFQASSNYLVALSKPLAEVLQSEPAAFDRMHVNRGDGDGRIHL